MKTILGTVIYSQAKAFWPELRASIESQSCQDFDTLIVNDNYSQETRKTLGISTMKNTSLVDKCQDRLTPGLLRVELIEAAKRAGGDLLIVADADDTFEKTRVESYIRAYEKDSSYAFYYNDLMTQDRQQSDGLAHKAVRSFDKDMKREPRAGSQLILTDLPKEITSVRDISQSNFLGMSTTAINLHALSYDFIDSLREGDTKIFDWYLFSRILMDVGPGKYVEHAATFYRIHDANIVGTSHDVDQERRVKLTHYENLGKKYPYFQHLYQDLKALDVNTIDIAPQGRDGRWWSCIKMEDHYEI